MASWGQNLTPRLSWLGVSFVQITELIYSIRITNMDHEELLQHIRNIRSVRTSYTSTIKSKREAKTRTKQKSDLEKLLDKMTAAERAALIATLNE